MYSVISNSKDKIEFKYSLAKMTAQCDNCKQAIDLSKPKKGKKGEKIESNPAVQAQMEFPPSNELKDYHFCDVKCLYLFLKDKFKK